MSLPFETKQNQDGTPNPKYVDLLDEDRPISGQKFVCVSFVSPENILKKKEIFYFEQFLKQWEFSKSLQKFTEFVNFVSYKFGLNIEELTEDLKQFFKDEQDKIAYSTLLDDYKIYVDKEDESLQAEFNKVCNFQTNLRGLKIRGSYPSVEEAQMRSKMIMEQDPNHNVYVGPVGVWMPWDPEPHKTGRVEYMEEELNQLMSEKQKNEAQAKVEFEERVKEAKSKAMENNNKMSEKTGNPLSQTILEDGTLVSVKETLEGEEITVADIQAKLF